MVTGLVGIDKTMVHFGFKKAFRYPSTWTKKYDQVEDSTQLVKKNPRIMSQQHDAVAQQKPPHQTDFAM